MSYTVKIKKEAQKFYESLRKVYRTINVRTGGFIGIVRHAFNHFSAARGAEAAAGISYYALFSIFPMLLVFISIGGYFLEREVAQEMVLNAVTAVIPNAANVINNNIASVLQLRGAVGIVALITLIWSATSVFNMVILNINRAFPESRVPNFLHRRFLSLIIIIILGFLFILSLATTTVSEIIPSFTIPINGKYLHETTLWRIFALSLPFVVKFFLFWAIYHWVPLTPVKRPAAVISAGFTALAWEIVTNGFTWFLGSGFATFRLIYGSVGAIVALMFWIYLTGMITIFGAHLTYAINYHLGVKARTKLKVKDAA